MVHMRALLEATFPIQSQYFSLEWVPSADPDAVAPDVDLYVVLRLITFHDDEGEHLIRDVKEQELLLVPARSRQDPRLEAWLTGTRQALLAIMHSQDPWCAGGRSWIPDGCTPVDYMLPFNLVSPDALQLVRPRTAEDFAKALLKSKRRLGGLLFPPPQAQAEG